MIFNRTSAIATAVVVALGGAGAAVAIADSGGGDSDTWPTVTASIVTAVTDGSAGLPESEALRLHLISRVSLLREPAAAEDKVPTRYWRETKRSGPTRVTKRDLQFARRVPGAEATWVVPLPAGTLMLVEDGRGVQFGAKQLDTGAAVLSRSNVAGETVVTGVVPDGTHAVTIRTTSGEEVPVRVTNSTYVRRFSKGAWPRSITTTTKKGRTVAWIADSRFIEQRPGAAPDTANRRTESELYCRQVDLTDPASSQRVMLSRSWSCGRPGPRHKVD